MVRGYETVLIVDAMLSDDQIESVVKEVETFLGGKGQLKNVDRRGKRRLAYEVNKKNHGHYTVFNYKAEGNAVAELERKLNLNENVLRFLTVSRELPQ